MDTIAKLLTPREAATILGVTPSTMNYWRTTRRGPSWVKVGHLARYRQEDIAAYIEAHTTRVVAADAAGKGGIR